MKTLLVIVGPTGSGKTALSLQLAQQYNCPIICADSRQVYKELPIGTAAPTWEEKQMIPHYLVGHLPLTAEYNAGQFARDAEQLLDQLFVLHDIVIMVGGSMLYIEAVCNGLDDIPPVDRTIRKQVQEDFAQKGLAWLQGEVSRLDPVYWQKVDTQNPQRLMHCLEICLATGKPYSSFCSNRVCSVQKPYQIQIQQVEIPREQLYERINQRVDKMMELGLEQEAREAFIQLGINLQINDNKVLPNSVNTVGYKELLAYFRGEWTREKAIEMIKQNTRHYAKRQMTWWRNRL